MIIKNFVSQNAEVRRNLQEKETPNEFLPYIAEYETAKGSPINPHIKIFFYDNSELPLDHVGRIKNGMCFMGLNFIFIEVNTWLDPILSNTLTVFSLLDGFSNGEIHQLPHTLIELASEYENMSDAERNQFKEAEIRARQERLSDIEKLILRSANRRITLFHELGHCDLNLDDEENNLSIMNQEQDPILRTILEDPDIYPILLNDLFSYKETVMYKSNTLYSISFNPLTLTRESDIFLSRLPMLLNDLQLLSEITLLD